MRCGEPAGASVLRLRRQCVPFRPCRHAHHDPQALGSSMSQALGLPQAVGCRDGPCQCVRAVRAGAIPIRLALPLRQGGVIWSRGVTQRTSRHRNVFARGCWQLASGGRPQPTATRPRTSCPPVCTLSQSPTCRGRWRRRRLNSQLPLQRKMMLQTKRQRPADCTGQPLRISEWKHCRFRRFYGPLYNLACVYGFDL